MDQELARIREGGGTEEIASNNLEDRKWHALKERYREMQHRCARLSLSETKQISIVE